MYVSAMLPGRMEVKVQWRIGRSVIYSNKFQKDGFAGKKVLRIPRYRSALSVGNDAKANTVPTNG
jgi:hypothetical protein